MNNVAVYEVQAKLFKFIYIPRHYSITACSRN